MTLFVSSHAFMGAMGFVLFVAASWLAWRQYHLRLSAVSFDLARGLQGCGLWWTGVALTALRDPGMLAQAWPPGGAFSLATLLYLQGLGGAMVLFCVWQVAGTYQHHIWREHP